MTENLHILLVDDQQLFRKGLAEIIRGFKSVRTVDEVENGKQLLERLSEPVPKPDIIIMDLSMPEMNGKEAAEKIQVLYPELRIIILSVHYKESFISAMLTLGVKGYLYKNTSPAELEKAISDVMEKDFYFNELTLSAIRKKGQTRLGNDLVNNPDRLTKREEEVLKLICQEHTAAEIAEKLFISVRTVDAHRLNLLEKTGARNTAGLVVFAVRNGLIMPY